MSGDRFAQYDAAYVLGALSSDERLEYETHLRACPECAAAVADLAGLPGLLATVSVEDVLSPAEPVPDTLAPRLVRAVRRERRVRRVAAVAAAAVVAATAGTLGVVAGHAGSSPATDAAPGTTMSQVAATPVHASARFVTVPWGTRIDLTCTYDGSRYGNATAAYTLVVVDRGGTTQQIATWRAVPDGVSRVSAATAWSRADIARVEIRTASGAPVLRLLS